jgi:uncharacterized protein
MNLHRSQLPGICKSIIDALADARQIETPNRPSAATDLEAVLASYLEQEREISDRARELAQQRGLPPTEVARIKRLVADQRGIKVGDDALDYVLDQLVHMLMHSEHVDEVYAADHDLRRTMRGFILEKEGEDVKLEAEVRGKLKHVTEGSRMWEIEYQRMKDEIKRRRGL